MGMCGKKFPISIIPHLLMLDLAEKTSRMPGGVGLRGCAALCYTEACQILPLLLND